MSNNESKCGVVSDFNLELGFNVGDIVTVILHGDDNEYTGAVINPKKLWVGLSDYGRPFIADECSIKTVKKKSLKTGDKFTIDGCGKSARGHIVINGRSVKTGRKMTVKNLTLFSVIKT
jgi:hypothetical protein